MKINVPILVIVFLAIITTFVWLKTSRENEIRFRHYVKNDPIDVAIFESEKKKVKDNLLVGKMSIVGTVIILWLGIWNPTVKFNTERELAASQKSAYLTAYENGWRDQCEGLFSRLGGISNYAYGRGIVLSYPQCTSLVSASAAADAFTEHIGGYIQNSTDYDMKEDGRNQANRDLLIAVFNISPYWCYGSECLSGEDFGVFRPN